MTIRMCALFVFKPLKFIRFDVSHLHKFYVAFPFRFIHFILFNLILFHGMIFNCSYGARYELISQTCCQNFEKPLITAGAN